MKDILYFAVMNLKIFNALVLKEKRWFYNGVKRCYIFVLNMNLRNKTR